MIIKPQEIKIVCWQGVTLLTLLVTTGDIKKQKYFSLFNCISGHKKKGKIRDRKTEINK